MTNVTATENQLITTYTGYGSWIGLATGNPGSAATPSNEATGGSPAYVRQLTTWTVASGSAAATGSSVTFHVPAGTYNYMLFRSGSSGNNMVDWAAIPPMTVTSQSTITLTPTAVAS